MSWFDEQIRYRKLKDDEILSEAYVEIASAVVGHRLQQSWQDESYAAKTALEEICKYYHVKMRDIPPGIKEFNEQLDYVLQPSGIARRSVRLKEDWYKNAIGAMIGSRKSDGKVIALIPGKTDGYIYEDLEQGKSIKINKENAKLLEEEAIVFYRPFPLHSMSERDLFQFIRECLSGRDYLWYFVALSVITLIGLMTPKFGHLLFSEVVEYKRSSLLLATLLFFVCVTISLRLLEATKSLLVARIGSKLNLSVQAAVMMRLLSMPTKFFRNYTVGELNQQIKKMNRLCSLLGSAVFSMGFTVVFSLVFLIQIFYYAKALVIPTVFITLLSFAFSILCILFEMKHNKTVMELSGNEQGMVYSMITGIYKIRLSGAEKRAFARWGKLYAKEATEMYQSPWILKYSNVITSAIGLFGNIWIYYVAVAKGISVADYYAFTMCYAYITSAFSSFSDMAGTIATIRPILQLVKPMLETEPEISEEKEVVTKLSGRIELSHVSFRYPDSDQYLLDDVSLKIRPNQYVAVVGKTGCGKSTLVRLLLGFETPTKGAIYYDGKDLNKLDKKSLRRKLGVVLQNGKLINGDILSNITISAPWLQEKDAWKAAEIAGIADDIRQMPMGMHTIIHEGSGVISGGQRQRIMIARAVVANPKVLFLDEATSALDNITQKHVSDAMDHMRCTRILIAHRLSTIKQCDRILVLDQGKIMEDGSYEELMAVNGIFAQLVERQKIDE
ncbi:MAG: ATP-binding cassette domain-containing protein [Eubacteriales bacterium]|nr:ATP-binding cassette domain-containing protein [Eubacteriales bacterium]